MPGSLGGFLVLQVTAEEAGARVIALGADQQFAGFSRCDIGAVIVDEAILHAFRRTADATRAKAGRFARRGGGRRATGLGHRPGLDDRNTVTLLEGGAVADVDARRKGEAHAVLPFHLGHRQLQQNGRDDAETMHDGCAAIGHALPPAIGVKAVERHHGAAEHHHADRAAAERVHVKHRQRRQVDLAVRLQFGHAALSEIPVGHLQEIAVREHAALGLAGAARREQQRAFSVEVGMLRDDVRLARRNTAVGIDQAGASERGPLRHLHAIRRRHQQVGLRQLELEGQFVGADVGVDRNDRNPERIEREPMQKEDRTIFEQQGNPRPASIAGGRVFGAQPIDLGLEGAVFDSESLRRVGQSRACRRQQEWRVRPPRGRGREGIGWRSIRVEAHCGHSSC